jgi:hypothetical protein
MTYTFVATIGIDIGLWCCDGCGAVVCHDSRSSHDDFHADLDAMQPRYA